MPKIEEIWAWVGTEDGESDEGIIGNYTGWGWIPLVGADRKRMESLRYVAEEVAKATGKPVKLIKFTTRVDVETIAGGSPHGKEGEERRDSLHRPHLAG